MRMEIAEFLNNQETDLFLRKKYDAVFFKYLAEKMYGFEIYPIEIWQEVFGNFKSLLIERMKA